MRPSALVTTELSSLVVHPLVELLDELESNDAVVGAARLGEQVAAVLRGLGIQRIDVPRVEDGVDAVPWSASCYEKWRRVGGGALTRENHRSA